MNKLPPMLNNDNKKANIPIIPDLPDFSNSTNMILISETEKQALQTKAYSIGYKKGREEGYDTGFDKGFDKGYTKGYNKGTSENKPISVQRKRKYDCNDQTMIDAANNMSPSMKDHIQKQMDICLDKDNTDNIDKTSLKYAQVTSTDMENILKASFIEYSTNCDLWKTYVSKDLRKKIRHKTNKSFKLHLYECLKENNIYTGTTGSYFNVNDIFYSDKTTGQLETVENIKIMYRMNKEIEKIYTKVRTEINAINKEKWKAKMDERERKKEEKKAKKAQRKKNAINKKRQHENIQVGGQNKNDKVQSVDKNDRDDNNNVLDVQEKENVEPPQKKQKLNNGSDKNVLA
eukprot:503430_1